MSLIQEVKKEPDPDSNRGMGGGFSVLEAIESRADKAEPTQNDKKAAEFEQSDFTTGPEIGGPQEPPPNQDPFTSTEPEGNPDQPSQASRMSAEYVCEMYELALSYGLSGYCGEAPNRFKFSKEERESVQEKGAQFMETVSFQVTPGQAFAAALAVPSVLKFIEAQQLRSDRKKQLRAAWLRKQAEAEMEAAGVVSAETKEAYTEAAGESQSVGGVTKDRKQFNIDSAGYFRLNNKGRYVKGDKPPWMKAPKWVVEITEELKEQGKSQAEINAACRKKFKQLAHV